MTNPTGAFVYDIEERAPSIPEAALRNQAVLGKAVHRDALIRLHQLWPHAKAFVRHDWEEPTPEEALEGKTGRRKTAVVIIRYPDDPDSVYAAGQAIKHPDDTWDRRRGIALAFNRALKQVSLNAKLTAAGYEEIPPKFGPTPGAPSGPPARYEP